MATWPLTLPSSPLLDGYSQEPEDSRIVSEVDAGARKIRNRYTGVVEKVKESYILSESQYQAFVDFYKNTLKNGAETFTKNNPTTGVSSIYRFAEPYKLTQVRYPYYQITLSLEILPE